MKKSAFITIIGRPNVGKSSLMNCIIGQKVAIVSDKPQTTRTKIMGVYTKDENQLVFIDTPGFHKPKNMLGKNMIKAVGDGMSDVDVALFVVEASTKFKIGENELPAAELALIEELKRRKLKAVLVINKIDLLESKEELLGIITNYSKYYDFASIIPLSARKKDGIDILIGEIMKFCKESPHYFNAEDITDQPERVMVAEMIREKLLELLKDEVPHGIAVGVEQMSERDDKDILDISAVIYCERDSHKGIIIGKGGSMLKKASTAARMELEDFFQIKVNLQCWVKVKEDWRNREGLIRSFGLSDK